jgi:hypothetical protein
LVSGFSTSRSYYLSQLSASTPVGPESHKVMGWSILKSSRRAIFFQHDVSPPLFSSWRSLLTSKVSVSHDLCFSFETITIDLRGLIRSLQKQKQKQKQQRSLRGTSLSLSLSCHIPHHIMKSFSNTSLVIRRNCDCDYLFFVGVVRRSLLHLYFSLVTNNRYFDYVGSFIYFATTTLFMDEEWWQSRKRGRRSVRLRRQLRTPQLQFPYAGDVRSGHKHPASSPRRIGENPITTDSGIPNTSSKPLYLPGCRSQIGRKD